MNFQLDSTGVLRLEAWRDLPWLLHGFTTRHAGDFASATPDAESLRRMGADGMQLRTVRQVHSDRVCLLSDKEGNWDPVRRPEADALVTALPGHLLGVRTADCLPVLLVDRGKRAIAAVHAGWRGTYQQIAARGVEKMRACFGSEPQDLEAAIGPGIAACCFEVGPEVAEQFDPSLVHTPQPNATNPGIASPGAAGPNPRPHVDLVAANRKQLLEQGIPDANIWSSGSCTCCREGDFFSYRRGGDTARMLAFIGIQSTL
jgi:hypothetical protein